MVVKPTRGRASSAFDFLLSVIRCQGIVCVGDVVHALLCRDAANMEISGQIRFKFNNPNGAHVKFV